MTQSAKLFITLLRQLVLYVVFVGVVLCQLVKGVYEFLDYKTVLVILCTATWFAGILLLLIELWG